MKKQIVIAAVILLIAIALIVIFYPSEDNGYKKINVNNEVMNKYPVLNADQFYNTELTLEDGNYVSVDGNTIQIQSGLGDFLYNNKAYAPQLAYDAPCPEVLDCGSSIYVVDFESFYLVYSIGDAGPRVFGPFYKTD